MKKLDKVGNFDFTAFRRYQIIAGFVHRERASAQEMRENGTLQRWHGYEYYGSGLFRHFPEKISRPFVKSSARSGVLVFLTVVLIVGALACTRLLDPTVSITPTLISFLSDREFKVGFLESKTCMIETTLSFRYLATYQLNFK